MNPVGDYTVTFGGGDFTNWPRGTPSIWSVVEKNPDPRPADQGDGLHHEP